MSVTLRQFYKPLAIAVAVGFLYFTVGLKLGNDWWHDENYSHGLLIPFVIGFILWQQRDKFATEPARPSVLLGGLAVAFALFALWTGVAGAELYTQRMSLVLLIAGTVVYFFGLGFLRVRRHRDVGADERTDRSHGQRRQAAVKATRPG